MQVPVRCQPGGMVNKAPALSFPQTFSKVGPRSPGQQQSSPGEGAAVTMDDHWEAKHDQSQVLWNSRTSSQDCPLEGSAVTYAVIALGLERVWLPAVLVLKCHKPTLSWVLPEHGVDSGGRCLGPHPGSVVGVSKPVLGDPQHSAWHQVLQGPLEDGLRIF